MAVRSPGTMASCSSGGRGWQGAAHADRAQDRRAGGGHIRPVVLSPVTQTSKPDGPRLSVAASLGKRPKAQSATPPSNPAGARQYIMPVISFTRSPTNQDLCGVVSRILTEKNLALSCSARPTRARATSEVNLRLMVVAESGCTVFDRSNAALISFNYS